MAAEDGPFAINSDGSAKDPLAFQKALKEDASKLKALEAEPEVYKIVWDGDSDNFQQLLRAAYAVRSCAARQTIVSFQDRCAMSHRNSTQYCRIKLAG